MSRIVQLVNQNGSARVDELSELFGVSVITIRRDLELLELQGQLEKTHGGAVSRTLITDFPEYSTKKCEREPEKVAIGRAAAALIEEGDTVFVGAGTTAAQVMIALTDHRNLRIITNNVAGASLLTGNAFEVILLGGNYAASSGSTVGEFLDEMISNIFADKAIIGVDGIGFKSGLSSPSVQASSIAKKIIAQTEGDIIVVADHTKVGRRSNFTFASLAEIDVLVTDEGIDPSLITEIQSSGVQVIVAPVEQ